MARILIADDDPVFLEVTFLMLETRGHDVVAAADGDEALAILAKEAFDLIIVDIFMPNRDGLEVILELRQTCPAMRVVAVSSMSLGGGGDQLLTARAFGAHAVLPKPLSAALLDDVIAHLTQGSCPRADLFLN